MARLLHVLLFGLGLLLTAFGLRSADPLPYWSWGRAKMAHWLAVKDTTNVVAVGSSHVHYGVLPEAFDAAAAALAADARTFNLGVSGHRFQETAGVIDWLLDQRPANLKLLFVELYSSDQRPRGGSWMTDQEIEVHTLQGLWPRLQSLAADGQEARGKLWSLGHILAHTATNALRIGQGARILDDLAAQAGGRPLPGMHAVEEQGFESADRNAGADFVESARRLAAEPDYGPSLLRWRAERANLGVSDWPFATAELERLDRRIRAAGITPVYLTLPSHYGGVPGQAAIAQLADRIPLLHYDDPAGRPDLFDRALYYDPGHFSRLGAEVFSRRLAADADRLVSLPSTLDAARGQRTAAPMLRVRPAASGAGWTADAMSPAAADAGIVAIGERSEPAPLGLGMQLHMRWPPLWSAPVALDQAGTATVALPATADPALLVVQVGFLREGILVAVSPPARLQPIR